MRQAVSIRLGGRHDRDYVLDLGRRVAATSLSALRPVPLALAETAYDRLIAYIFAHECDVLIATDDGVPCGFLLLLRDLPDEVTLTEQGFVAYMAVEPDLQRRGIGGALLRGAHDMARAHGLAFLSLMVTEDNAAARGLYERFGLATERRLMTMAVQ